MTITFRCPQCGNSATSERELAELCPCNQMDRQRPTLRLVLTVVLLIGLVVSPFLLIMSEIPVTP